MSLIPGAMEHSRRKTMHASLQIGMVAVLVMCLIGLAVLFSGAWR